jgi:Fic-DOC domain mobile mystery protein B
MNGLFGGTDGQTPLDPDESKSLIPDHIITRGQLDQWELENIAEADRWTRTRPPRSEQLLSEIYLRRLHKRMFSKTWRWAGTFRRSDKNIGIDWRQVPVRLNQLLENLRYRLENGETDTDALATEFHHQLVFIHPFPNGNGRWSRMATDLLLESLGAEPFSWGANDKQPMDEIRDRYIAALREGDRGNLQPLAEFTRS